MSYDILMRAGLRSFISYPRVMRKVNIIGATIVIIAPSENWKIGRIFSFFSSSKVSENKWNEG